MSVTAILGALLAAVKLLSAIATFAQESRWENLGRADAFAAAANHVMDMVKQAQEVRDEQARADPATLRDDDGMRRND